jgi:DNA-binding transcriptional regulator YiaG
MTADELRAALKDLGMSQVHFAGLLGVNTHTVKHWLAGKNQVPQYAGLVVELLTERQNTQDARLHLADLRRSLSDLDEELAKIP